MLEMKTKHRRGEKDNKIKHMRENRNDDKKGKQNVMREKQQ